MKNISTFLFLIILSFSVCGQTNNIGVKGGLNWTNISINHRIYGDFGIKSNIVQCFLTGLTYDHISIKGIGFGAEILYEQRKYTDTLKQIDPVTNTSSIYLNDHFSYLSIPIKFGYNIGNTFWGFGNIGIAPSFLLNAKEIETTTNQGMITSIKEYNLTKSSNRLELGGLIEIGCGYKLANRFSVVSSFRLQKSFTSPDRPSNYIYWWGMNLNVGIRYIILTGSTQKETIKK